MALTITAIGSASDTANGTSLVITTTAAVPAGAMILVFAACANTGTAGASVLTGVVDSDSNTYTERSIVNYTPGGAAGDGATLGIYTAVPASELASGDTITINHSTSNTRSAVAYKAVPGAGETVEFGSVDGAGSTGNTNSYSAPTVSVTSGHTIFGAASIETDDTITGDTDTDNGSWTGAQTALADAGPDTTAQTIYAEHKTATGTGNQSWACTTTTARDSARNYIIIYPQESGGTEYTQDVAGTLTSAGNPVKQTAKPVAGALTSSGDVVKQAAKLLAGTLTSIGTLVKVAQKRASIGGTLTSVGDVVKQTAKPLVGALTSAGELAASKIALLSLEGTLTSAGDVVRQAGKGLAGTLTSIGTMVKSARKRTGISGTLTSAGDVVRQSVKGLAGTLTSAGDVSGFKVALLALAGTLTSSGDVARQAGKALAGTLTSAGATAVSVRKRLSGALTSAGDVVKQTAKTLSGTLTSAGALVTSGITALVHLTAQVRDFGLTAMARNFELAAKIRDFSLTSRTRDTGE